MSDFQNLDLRSPRARRAAGGSLRGILIALGVVFALFVLLAMLGTANEDGDAVAPAGDAQQSAPVATELVGE